MVKRLLTIENQIINWNKRIIKYSVFGKYRLKLQYHDCCKISIHGVIVSSLIVDIIISRFPLIYVCTYLPKKNPKLRSFILYKD
jgi:hypothetical protein